MTGPREFQTRLPHIGKDARAQYGKWDPCQCGHPRLVHVQLKRAECLRCDCTRFVRARQP